MMRVVRTLLAVAMVASWPLAAVAEPAPANSTVAASKKPAAKKTATKQRWRGYGFLPGYRQPPNLTDWRYRSARYRSPYPRYEMRYWRYGQPEYGWGWPGTYRGRWNGGSFGPCWTYTPIGMVWNCGR